MMISTDCRLLLNLVLLLLPLRLSHQPHHLNLVDQPLMRATRADLAMHPGHNRSLSILVHIQGSHRGASKGLPPRIPLPIAATGPTLSSVTKERLVLGHPQSTPKWVTTEDKMVMGYWARARMGHTAPRLQETSSKIDADVANTIQPRDKVCTRCLRERQNDITSLLDMTRGLAATKITTGQQQEQDHTMGSSIIGSLSVRPGFFLGV